MGEIDKPQQVILVSCRHAGKDNIMAVAWHMPVSFEPELYAISVAKKRHSYEMIKKSRAFVVNFMPFDMKNAVLYCGTHSGRDVDKFREARLGKEEATKIKCPIIKQCSAFMECRLVNEINTGDHAIFVGEVLKSGKKNEKKRIFQANGRERYSFTTTIDVPKG